MGGGGGAIVVPFALCTAQKPAFVTLFVRLRGSDRAPPLLSQRESTMHCFSLGCVPVSKTPSLVYCPTLPDVPRYFYCLGLLFCIFFSLTIFFVFLFVVVFVCRSLSSQCSKHLDN